MRASRWVPGAAALLLLVGVVAARDGSAADDTDLRPPVTEPSEAPSTGSPEEPPTVIEANGVTGARLGSGASTVETWAGEGAPDLADYPAGCVPANLRDQEFSEGWSTSVWVVDGLVSSVAVTAFDTPEAVVEQVRTWLGPTLGSPVQAASELPGARTTVERPFGAEGPDVTVVRVPGDGVETVFSDAAYDRGPGREAGRVTSIEVRHPRARPCSLEALFEASPVLYPQGPAVDLTIGPDGLVVAPLGTPLAVVEQVPGLVPDGAFGAGCASFSAAGTTDGTGGLGWGSARITVVDGVVVQARTDGDAPSLLPVGPGSSISDVLAAYPQLATDPSGPGGLDDVSYQLVEGGRSIGIQLGKEQRWVDDVDVAVSGGPHVVRSLVVTDLAAQQDTLC